MDHDREIDKANDEKEFLPFRGQRYGQIHLTRNPAELGQQLNAFPDKTAWVVIDEIQKVPKHMAPCPGCRPSLHVKRRTPSSEPTP